MEYSSTSLHPWANLICAHCSNTVRIPVYCGNRFCPECSRARTGRLRQKLDRFVKSIRLSPSHTLKFMTLTIPTGPDPELQFKLLLASFRRLRQRRWWRRRVVGGAAVIEITRSGFLWHVHLHAIVESAFLPYKSLSAEWAAVSPGKISDIRFISTPQLIGYLTKYMTKTSLSFDDQLTATRTLAGTRQLLTFGDWYGRMAKIKIEVVRCHICNSQDWIYDDPDTSLIGRLFYRNRSMITIWAEHPP